MSQTEKPSIEKVLEHYGVIGHKRMVRCPLNEDRNPSCSIDYANNLFNCHACGEAGDSWTLIMKKENCDFRGAVEFARTTLGVTTRSTGGGRRKLRGSSYATGGAVADPEGDLPGDRPWRPSWSRE